MKTKIIGMLTLVFSSFLHAESYDLAIKNVTVIDGVTRQSGQTVLISDNEIRVVAVEPTYTARRLIDGTDKYLMPGLWDMHVHIVYEDALVESMPGLFLDYGITSVRDTGALLDKISPQVKRWEGLGNEAPELFFSGPLLDGSLVVYDGKGRPEIGVRNSSVPKALKNFRALQAAGVDFIKIYELVSPEVFAALVEAAEDAKLPIAAHVPLAMMADVAGPRVGSMEHLRNIEIACASDANDLFASRAEQIANPTKASGYELRSHLHSSQRQVALTTADPKSTRCTDVIRALTSTIQVPTLRLNTLAKFSPLDRADWQLSLQQMPAPLAKQWFESAQLYAGIESELRNKMSDWSLQLVAEMNRAGVPIGAGTDTPIGLAIPGYSLHTELERLVDAGLSPQEAIAAATIRPAEFFGLEEKMGRIETGMEADLVLLSKDPLQDIANTRSIAHVIANGVLVR